MIDAQVEDLDREIRDGIRVEQLMKDESVLRAFQKVEDGYIDRWKKASTRDTREELHAKLSALSDVKAQLEATIGAGNMAQKKKEQKERQVLATARRGQ